MDWSGNPLDDTAQYARSQTHKQTQR